jgi:hypothetical protein
LRFPVDVLLAFHPKPVGPYKWQQGAVGIQLWLVVEVIARSRKEREVPREAP